MRHYVLIVSVLFFSTNTVAEALFGTLFFTPAQRAEMDKARLMQPSHIEKETTSQQVNTPMKPVVINKIQGYVKRNDGQQSTVWLNGKAVQKRVVPHAVFE